MGAGEGILQEGAYDCMRRSACASPCFLSIEGTDRRRGLASDLKSALSPNRIGADYLQQLLGDVPVDPDFGVSPGTTPRGLTPRGYAAESTSGQTVNIQDARCSHSAHLTPLCK